MTIISFINTIKFAYLQRVRSYGFLVTACLSVALAYTFVPADGASYSTINISNYEGVYNAAWFGYVTATMSSCFLSLIGFYLVNNSIYKDKESKVGQIVATTNISNFGYLLSKALTNFMILFTIVLIVLLTSIALFLSYNNGYPFEAMQFIKPYVLTTIPAMFSIAIIALISEVFFGKYSVIQNMVFFFFICSIFAFWPENDWQFCMDPLGSKIVTNQMIEAAKDHINTDEELNLNIGYTIASSTNADKFEFTGVNFSNLFILSRLLWISLGIALITLVAPFFHRFNLTDKPLAKQKTITDVQQPSAKEIVLSQLSKVDINYGVFPLIKTELLLVIRKTNRWLWLLNTTGFILLATLPLDLAHQMVLPILWFIQVGWLSKITAKEFLNNLQLLTSSSYQPIQRLFTSQLLAALLFLCFLASPLLLRLAVSGSFLPVISIILGGLFIVLLASLLGIITKGKRLFEVLFFLISYSNINGIWFMDYFGAIRHDMSYNMVLFVLVFLLGTINFISKISNSR